jgi:hypothetical protein
LGDGSERCRQSIWLPSECCCGQGLRRVWATVGGVGAGVMLAVTGLVTHHEVRLRFSHDCLLRPFIPSHRIASIYSIPYLPAVIISQPSLFTDMKNFKKSLVSASSFSCPSLTPLPSFVQKTQILQKTSPLNRLQRPPLLPLPPLH